MSRQGRFPESVMAMTLAVPGIARADGGGYGDGRFAASPAYHASYYPRDYPQYQPSCR